MYTQSYNSGIFTWERKYQLCMSDYRKINNQLEKNFFSFMNLNNFPFSSCTRIRKYISSTSLSLPLQGELLAPSSTHLQKCVNISRTQLPPLDNNLSVSLGSQFHCAVSSWGKGSCLAKSVFHAQSSSYLVSWRLFLQFVTLLETLSLLGFRDTSVSWSLLPSLADLSPSPLLLPLSLPSH